MSMKNVKINEYEAAVEFGFSPELLRWFTSFSVIDDEKLAYQEINSLYVFKLSDLQKIDKKMLGKWPLPPSGTRPTIPEGIKREIKKEAQFCCPVCKSVQGELAHIRPVAKTLCNHPNNLIFLCANHHTEYDYGYIYKNVDIEDIKSYKDNLKRFNKHQWSVKGQLIQTYLGALNTAKSLLEIHESSVKNLIDDAKFEEVLNKIATSIEKKRKKKNKQNMLNLTVESLVEEIEDYTKSNSEDLCPLCSGLGSTSFYDPCPICLGNGEIQKNDIRLDRLDEFKCVDCRFCDGSGVKDGDDCPACGGERQVAQGWAEQHDWTQYKLVNCPICRGSGDVGDDDCPVCEGRFKVYKGWAENYDSYDYQ